MKNKNHYKKWNKTGRLPVSNKYVLTIMKISSFVLFGYNVSFGQIGLRVFNYRPTGEFGFVMKPNYSVELGYMASFKDDGRLRFNTSITYLVMKPRLESFPVYGVLTQGNGTSLLPGEQSFKKYNIGLLFVGYDFAFIKKAPFAFYAGVDIMMGGANVKYTNVIETYTNESYSGGGIIGGLRFCLGSEYLINKHFGIFLNANRQVFLISEPQGIFGANDYGLGMHYSF